MLKRRSGLLKGLSTSLALAMSLLTGCATAGSCQLLAFPDYKSDFNLALSMEILAAPAGAKWPDAIEDYRALRRAVRDCKGSS